MLTVDETAFAMLGLVALAATRKRTAKAARRCAKRIDRALLRVQSGAVPGLHGHMVSPEAAFGITVIAARTCRMCGICSGR